MIANCYGGSNVLHMLILHSKCSINVPTSCVWPGTCRNIWNVPNLLSAGRWQVLSTRACNVLKMFSLVSRPPCPQCWAMEGWWRIYHNVWTWQSSIPVDMSCPVYNTTFYLSHHLVLCYQPREESTRSRDMVAGEAGDSEGETTCPF